MSWLKREVQNRDIRRSGALEALQKSEQDYQAVQQLRPMVETQVTKHLVLQRENHFAQRMEWAYRGGAR